MADYRVRVPEPNAPQVNPYLGMYQDGYGSAISSTGRDLASVGNAFTRGGRGSGGSSDYLAAQRYMQEQRNANDLATFALGALDQGMEEGRRILSETLGYELTVDEALNLRSSALDSLKLDQADLQRPRSALNQMRRAAHTRQSIASSPLIAKEIFALYKSGMGQGVLEGLEDITRDFEDPRAATIKAVREGFFAMGGDPLTTPYEQQAEAVSRFAQLKTRKEASDLRLGLRSNAEQMDAYDALRDARQEHIPFVLQELQATIVKTAAEFGGDPANMTADQRITAANRLQEYYMEKTAELRSKYSSAKLSDADYNAMAAPLTAMFEHGMAMLSGQQSYDSLKLQNDIIIEASTNEFFQQFPEMRNVVVASNIFKDLPPDFLDAIGAMDVGRKMMPIVAPAFGAWLDNTSTKMMFNSKYKEGPEKYKQFLQDGKKTTRLLLDPTRTTDQEFGNFIENVFGAYNTDRASREAFHEWLPELASPAGLERIRKMPDAQRAAALQNGLGEYVDNIKEQLTNRISTTWRGAAWNFESEKVDPEPGAYPGPRTRITFFENVQPYITATYREDGMPVFRAEGNIPDDVKSKVAQTVKDLNAVAPRIKDVAQLSLALGTETGFTPSQIAEVLVTQGQFPSRVVRETQN